MYIRVTGGVSNNAQTQTRLPTHTSLSLVHLDDPSQLHILFWRNWNLQLILLADLCSTKLDPFACTTIATRDMPSQAPQPPTTRHGEEG